MFVTTYIPLGYWPIAGYCPRSFSWGGGVGGAGTETESNSINTQKGTTPASSLVYRILLLLGIKEAILLRGNSE